MSKQQQAPGQLETVRSFVNTVDIEQGIEQLTGPPDLGQWLVARDLAGDDIRATRQDFRRAVAVREALRQVLLAHTDGSAAPEDATRTLDDAARRARLRLRFGDDGGTALEPQASGVDGAIGRLLAIVHGSIADGTWQRLKACREHTCEWAFYDHTKNRSGTWCNMAVCGNRSKARAYRERRGPSNEDETFHLRRVRG
jgi:predicted RNA-binding Zn ribbon-like protein